MKLGLIDEYRLFVSPVVLGGGTPYFRPWTRGSTWSSSRHGGSALASLTFATSVWKRAG
jgi:dihydrofolate reductase